MYKSGLFGDYAPTESIAPKFSDNEDRLIYYTLPMALNYRRPSIQLWTAAKQSYLDPETKQCFDLQFVSGLNEGSDELNLLLARYKLSLQPSRHPIMWHKISSVIIEEAGSIGGLLSSVDYDFLKLRDFVQVKHKKRFPYLSGPKLFNFWCYILAEYCEVDFLHKEHIDIAVDSHIRRASSAIGLITDLEMDNLSTELIAQKWREALHGSALAPVDLNVPLWYWSRAKFTTGGLEF